MTSPHLNEPPDNPQKYDPTEREREREGGREREREKEKGGREREREGERDATAAHLNNPSPRLKGVETQA